MIIIIKLKLSRKKVTFPPHTSISFDEGEIKAGSLTLSISGISYLE